MLDEQRGKIQSEAGQALQQSGDNGIVILPTGTGKSRVAVQRLIELAARYPEGTIIYTCDNLRLRDVDFPAELIKWGGGHLMGRIRRECYAAAYRISGEHFDIWLADEFDYMLTPEYVKFFANNTFNHKILFSATLEDYKREWGTYIAPIVYEKETWEIEQAGVINKTLHRLVAYELTPFENDIYLSFHEQFENYFMIPEDKRNPKQFDRITRARATFLRNLESSRTICRLLISHLHNNVPGTRALVYSGSSTQLRFIMPWTYYQGNEKEGWLDKFESGEINFLGVIGKIDRGANLNNVNTVIFETITGSATKMIQRSGRGKRLDKDEMLNAYYLIPFYRTLRGNLKETIVANWFDESTKKIDLSFIENYTIPCHTPKISS